MKPHSLSEIVKNNKLEMLKMLKRRLIILWTNNITSKVIPVKTEMLGNILWYQMKKVTSARKEISPQLGESKSATYSEYLLTFGDKKAY